MTNLLVAWGQFIDHDITLTSSTKVKILLYVFARICILDVPARWPPWLSTMSVELALLTMLALEVNILSKISLY